MLTALALTVGDFLDQSLEPCAIGSLTLIFNASSMSTTEVRLYTTEQDSRVRVKLMWITRAALQEFDLKRFGVQLDSGRNPAL